jgi:hypothetical protein
MGKASRFVSTKVPANKMMNLGHLGGRQYGNTSSVPSLYHCRPRAKTRFCLSKRAVDRTEAGG